MLGIELRKLLFLIKPIYQMRINKLKLFHYNFLRVSRHVLGDPNFPRLKLKQESIISSVSSDFETQNTQQVLPVKKLRRVKLDEVDFYKEFVKPGIPVVIEGGASDWDCIGKWSPSWLCEHYGDEPIIYIDSTPEQMEQKDYSSTLGKFSDVLTGINNGDVTKYIRFSPLLHDHPELLRDFNANWLKKMRHPFSTGKKLQLFVGPKGSKTDLHAAAEYNFFTQVYGRKHWYICSPKSDAALDPLNLGLAYFTSKFNPKFPDFKSFPISKDIDFHECILEPGDILYNPSSYWHQVENESDSIGVGFRWFNLLGSLQLSTIQTLLTLTCYNPPIWKAMRYSKRDFSKLFAQNNKK